MPSPGVTAAVSIGVVMELLRRGAQRSRNRAQEIMDKAVMRETVGQREEALRRAELLDRNRQMTQARMHMALQGRGIYAYGDPTSAPYIEEASRGMPGSLR